MDFGVILEWPDQSLKTPKRPVFRFFWFAGVRYSNRTEYYPLTLHENAATQLSIAQQSINR